MTKHKAFTITIDLGKGVKISAPFKKDWSVAEWRRMVKHIDTTIAGVPDMEKFK